ncbi:unnamed protein product, partial [Brassica oleracea]
SAPHAPAAENPQQSSPHRTDSFSDKSSGKPLTGLNEHAIRNQQRLGPWKTVTPTEKEETTRRQDEEGEEPASKN